MKRLGPLAFALLVSCGAARPAVERPPARDDSEERLAQELRGPENALALQAALHAHRGWMKYLLDSDPEGALAELKQAEPGALPETQALVLAGRAEIAEDRLQLLEAARDYVEALAVAPSSPLAELCAERLLEAEGDSRDVDELILTAVKNLHAGTEPRAARLLREAAAHVANSRSFIGGAPGERESWAAAGAIQRYRVAGPFAAERLLELDRPTALDMKDAADAPATGPAGSTAERALDFPDGDVGLELEPAEGDLFYAASTLTAAQGGDYLLVIEGAGALEARLDGQVALSRSPWPREVAREQTAAVHLDKGDHALLVRWSRAEGPRFRVSLARNDGAPGDLTSAAPARLSGLRKPSRCALGTACVAEPAYEDGGGLRGYAEKRLLRNPADTLAAFLLVRATLKDDRDATRAALDRLIALTHQGAPALALRVAEVLTDGDIPERIGHTLALADLNAAVEKDPRMLRAALTLAAMQRDAERIDDAGAILTRAESTARVLQGNDAPLPPRLIVARARLYDAQGNAALARAQAESARSRDGGRCDGIALAHELSRREGSLADQRALSELLLGCPEQRGALPQLLRDRGDLVGAEKMLARFVELRPAQPQRLAQLAELQAARGEVQGAIATMRRAVELAPRASDPWRQIAAWSDLAGDAKGAQAAREIALLRMPGDLQLRHQIALERNEKLLGWSDRDGLAVAKDAGSESFVRDAPERASAVRLLDYGGVELAADGSAIERVHTVVRLLDKTGIARFGEVQIPGDAEILELRNIKPDGRTLEPEAIPEKETHSLPGLEPGDTIEYDYLRAWAPRGPELPGVSLGAFFFADAETPMLESTYEVRAPASLPLEIDSRGLDKQEIAKTPEGLRYAHVERRIPAVRPEPNQPSEEEITPWTQLGFGAGNQNVQRSIADWALLRARPGPATDSLAEQAGGGTPREKLERIDALVSSVVRGRSNGGDFGTPAAHVLALGRGNRLLAIKAALTSAGVRSHLALVRPFGALPWTPRFPRGDLYAFAALYVDAQPGLEQPIWLDATWRTGPIGVLPPFARGRDAVLLPEPRENVGELRHVTTPGSLLDGDDGRVLTLDLTLDADGQVVGKGRDEARGFEAASLREALEQLDAQQRRQAVEQMLSRAIPGAVLESLTAEGETAPGGRSALDYRLRGRLGQPELGTHAMRVPTTMLPASLSRRYAELAERKKPLLISALERFQLHAAIALPGGLRLVTPDLVTLETPFGRYSWRAQELDGQLVIDESLALPPQRVAPADYAAFSAFCSKVDEVQAHDLFLQP